MKSSDVYSAMMKAADHIERNPREFAYSATGVPPAMDCGSPGCAIGWTAFFAGYSKADYSCVAFREFVDEKMQAIGEDLGDLVFYRRMNDIDLGWAETAARCAPAMRIYARKCHAPAVPNWEAMAATRVVADTVRSQEVA